MKYIPADVSGKTKLRLGTNIKYYPRRWVRWGHDVGRWGHDVGRKKISALRNFEIRVTLKEALQSSKYKGISSDQW